MGGGKHNKWKPMPLNCISTLLDFGSVFMKHRFLIMCVNTDVFVCLRLVCVRRQSGQGEGAVVWSNARAQGGRQIRAATTGSTTFTGRRGAQSPFPTWRPCVGLRTPCAGQTGAETGSVMSLPEQLSEPRSAVRLVFTCVCARVIGVVLKHSHLGSFTITCLCLLLTRNLFLWP